MKKSLYQIEQEYFEIAQYLEEGEFTEELENKLAITQGDLQTKAINYGFVIKDFDYDINMIDEEIKRLQAIKKAKVTAQERLKNTISDAMKLFKIEKIECPTLKISFRKSESIEITNQETLSNEYIVEKTTYTPDKVAIKKAIKDGVVFTGAELVVKSNIQIK